MTQARRTFKVGPHTVVCRTQRRYVLIAHRDEPTPDPKGGVYVPYAHIVKRSDNYRTLLNHAGRARTLHGPGAKLNIYDMTTGKEAI